MAFEKAMWHYLQFVPQPYLSILSLKNVGILVYAWIACLKKLKGKGKNYLMKLDRRAL